MFIFMILKLLIKNKNYVIFLFKNLMATLPIMRIYPFFICFLCLNMFLIFSQMFA